MNSALPYKKPIGILIVCSLLIMNYDIVLPCLDNNLFGIIFSTILFFIGGRETRLNLNYPLFAMFVVLEIISFRLHTKSVHLLAVALFICLLYYNITRKFSFIAFICLLLFSSLFNAFFEYLTTEIKQSLCYYVYLTLKNFIPINKIEGVNFYLNNAKITIDTACMGLSMFKTGLLSGGILLTLEEKKQKKYFSILQIFLFCCILIVLNIVANYFRIITLILFNCTEDNALHHTIGILCFLFYQITPMLFAVRFFKPEKEENTIKKEPYSVFFVFVGSLLLLVTSLEIKKEKSYDLLENLSPEYRTQKGIWVNKEVYKITTPEKLIYIKTPTHSPLVCWTGTGYKIIESEKIKKRNEKIWRVKMEKNNIQYYSYWWYECNNIKYTSLIEVFLLKLFSNTSVRLINETYKIQP